MLLVAQMAVVADMQPVADTPLAVRAVALQVVAQVWLLWSGKNENSTNSK
jgi:hypothetical protein